MIEWIIGFLVASWWSKREEENRKQKEQRENINYHKVPFGYLREDESIKDLT